MRVCVFVSSDRIVSPYDIVDSVTPCLQNGIWKDEKKLVLRMYVLIHRRTVGHGAGASTEYVLPFQGLNISLSPLQLSVVSEVANGNDARPDARCICLFALQAECHLQLYCLLPTTVLSVF